MWRSPLVSFFKAIHSILHSPSKILVICLFIAFSSLIIQGSLMQLWGLYQDFFDLQEKTKLIQTRTVQLEEKIRRSSDPKFLEQEARTRFDLAREGDLIFVFSEE